MVSAILPDVLLDDTYQDINVLNDWYSTRDSIISLKLLSYCGQCTLTVGLCFICRSSTMRCRNSLVVQLLISLAVCLSMICTLSEAYVLPVDYMHTIQGKCICLHCTTIITMPMTQSIQPRDQCTNVQQNYMICVTNLKTLLLGTNLKCNITSFYRKDLSHCGCATMYLRHARYQRLSNKKLVIPKN